MLTTSATAIAVTGTVVLDQGPGQGRRALTLPADQHIWVFEVERGVTTNGLPRRHGR